jgi:serine/threonine-protein kinase RsbW
MKRFSLRHDISGDPSGPVLEAIAHARAFAAENGLVEPVATRVKIVVEELVANVVAHGAAAKTIEVDAMLEVEHDGVRFGLDDNGIAFDPRNHPLPDRPHPMTGGGAGLPLVLAWANIVNYRREGERNRLELVIRC